jgi:hypothetical protein
MALNPPPQKLYAFLQEGIDDINEFAKGQGYGVSIYRSKTDKQIPPVVRKVWLRCAKGRSYKPTSRDRLTSSRMTRYEFNATITRTELGWALEI